MGENETPKRPSSSLSKKRSGYEGVKLSKTINQKNKLIPDVPKEKFQKKTISGCDELKLKMLDVDITGWNHGDD